MSDANDRERALATLQERAKELSCLYRVTEVLGREEGEPDALLQEALAAIPAGWQHPEVCHPALLLLGTLYRLPSFVDSQWVQRAPIRVRGRDIGELSVRYSEERRAEDEGPFLKEERQLLETLAERIGLFVLERDLLSSRPGAAPGADAIGRWRYMLEFLERVDPRLLDWIARKMLNHLRWKGEPRAEALLPADSRRAEVGDENRPLPPQQTQPPRVRPEEVFRLAADCCPEDEILTQLQMWISEDRVGFLIRTLEDQGSSLAEIANDLERFQSMRVGEHELPISVRTMLRVALLRRFFTDQIGFINSAKALVSIEDFHRLSRRLVHPPKSHGRLGGKSSGLFLARKVVESSIGREDVLRDVRVPRTWYVASDGLLAFVRHNSLEDIYDHKYLDIAEVRQQYPHVVQVFKSSAFPPELSAGLSTALDDLGDRPLIVRSSSLLEDRTGAAFSGKYKSLFLANQGSKNERLRALEDAVAEVYASIFGPDPLEYRAERNLVDVHEEMGIMIQEVVGTRVGRYYLPSFSGVAFSNNEFRWSPRIRREDGLVRLVPGLGTRAVDRLSDDYPVLLSPGQPGLRVNATVDELVHYAPGKVDLIDLGTGGFATVPVQDLLRECGNDLPGVRRMISILDHDRLRRPGGLAVDFDAQRAVVTFEGLVTDTPFLERIGTLLRVLREALGAPVDVEFASDGEHLHLLQCRTQSYGPDSTPDAIPKDLDPAHLLFTAHKHVSNGRVPDLTHIVYVDPERYAGLPTAEDLRRVGRAVSRLNKALPRRRFMLIGPGRWGSRGDIRLGVSVTYSDVNNTAVLAEVARRQGNYVPDLSFGTHFFQDLVEADIRYLPLYPDEPDNVFAEGFLRRATNQLERIAPEFADLADVLRVIDLPAETGGRVLRVLMNGDQDEAVGYLAAPTGSAPGRSFARARSSENRQQEQKKP